MALQQELAFDYYSFVTFDVYHGTNRFYELASITKQDTVALRAVNASVIHLSVNGNNQKAMDPT